MKEINYKNKLKILKDYQNLYWFLNFLFTFAGLLCLTTGIECFKENKKKFWIFLIIGALLAIISFLFDTKVEEMKKNKKRIRDWEIKKIISIKPELKEKFLEIQEKLEESEIQINYKLWKNRWKKHLFNNFFSFSILFFLFFLRRVLNLDVPFFLYLVSILVFVIIADFYWENLPEQKKIKKLKKQIWQLEKEIEKLAT